METDFPLRWRRITTCSWQTITNITNTLAGRRTDGQKGVLRPPQRLPSTDPSARPFVRPSVQLSFFFPPSQPQPVSASYGPLVKLLFYFSPSPLPSPVGMPAPWSCHVSSVPHRACTVVTSTYRTDGQRSCRCRCGERAPCLIGVWRPGPRGLGPVCRGARPGQGKKKRVAGECCGKRESLPG
jgi:hypothetical protein